MRGSYGNIHYSNRNTFGSNRAISLDANPRRMSDGIQTVTSDSSVYYNQHRSMDHDTYKSDSNNVLPAKVVVETEEHSKTPQEETNSGGKPTGTNRVQPSSTNNKFVKKSLCNNNNNNNNNTTSSNISSTKTIISRLRQLTGRLSFTFDKEARRVSSLNQKSAATSNQMAATSIKNNNMPNNCCSADASKQPLVNKTERGRALSLDVPPTKYNFNSGASSNDGSRKSLASTKNDESLADDSGENTENSVFITNNNTKKGSDGIDGADI